MPRNVYDQAGRYVAKLDPAGLLRWALAMPSLVFHRWLDTRRLPFPGETDRTCDTVACLEAPADPGMPWAVPVEFQIEPDADLFNRLLNYLGLLRQEERPSAQRGSRYHVGAVVLNLTGAGHTSQDMQFGATGMRTCLQVIERDLGREDAAATLAGVTAGTIAACLLPFIPLMHGGGEAGIIQQWLALASAEPDAKRRGDYGGLALVFAEAAGCHNVWKQALKGWNMVQSQQVLEWMAEGKAEGKAESILEILEVKFGPPPADLAATIRGTTDLATLKQWTAQAVKANTLDDFRQATHT